MRRPQSLSGKQKAALLLMSLGPELSARVLKYLRDDEIEQLTLEIATLRQVEPELQDRVLEEFHGVCLAREYISWGGIEYAKELLTRALGSQKASDILQRLTANLQVRPFDSLRRADASQLLNFIQNEHPQVIALILAHLRPEQAATVLAGLPPERQAEVTRRIALMDRTSPEVVRDLEQLLEKKLSSLGPQDYTVAGGIQSVVEVLNRVDRGTERAIMETLEVQDPELAEEIKARMFMFEDIVQLDDRSVQRFLREIDLSRDLPLALKAASEDVKQKIFRNMSKRAVENLLENMEYLGPVRLRDVEEAQQKIVNVIRKLEEEGEVIISRGGGEEILV